MASASPSVSGSATTSDPRPVYVTGVSTWNRRRYISRFIESYVATSSDTYRRVLVVADDGSTDGTLQFLRNLHLPDIQLIVIHNKRATISGQANSILLAAMACGFTFGVKCDDDIFFSGAGWDKLYYETAKTSGVHHLVYHNAGWKPPRHAFRDGVLSSHVPALDTMGCFYTFTPDVLQRVGYMDELNFPMRGHSHIDFTVRACRAGFNDAARVWDVADSNRHIDMWSRDDYVDLTDWSDSKVRQVLSPGERARRLEVINDAARVYVPYVPADPDRRSRIELYPGDAEMQSALLSTGRFHSVEAAAGIFDAVFVLNLDHQPLRWAITAESLSRHGVLFERYPAVNGNDRDCVEAWRSYTAKGLSLPEEVAINRRLIQSPGAWGYLATMKALLEEAQEQRLDRILVLDDDIMLHAGFGSVIEGAWSEVRDGWKLVYLGWSDRESARLDRVSDRLVRPSKSINGSFAVAMHASVFDEVIAAIDEYTWPYDAGPLRGVARSHPTDCYAMNPQLVVADVAHSSIRAPRDMSVFAKETAWRLEQYEDRGFALAGGAEGEMGELAAGGAAPLVSVLLVAGDDEDVVGRALLSLRHQTHGNIEMLCLQNGSRDRTGSVLAEHARRDSRIRLFSSDVELEEHVAWNLLLQWTRGAYVSIQDPQAVSHPRRYELLVSSSGSSPAVVGTATACAGEPPLRWGRLADWADERDTLVRKPSLTAGMVSAKVVSGVGGFIAGGEMGLRELVDRYALAVESTAEFPLIGVGVPETVKYYAEQVPREQHHPEASRYHDEIRAGVRPAFVPIVSSRTGLQVAMA